VPICHEGGWIQLTALDGSTEVDWHSRFEIAVPLLGWVVERLSGRLSWDAFGRLLEQVRDRLDGRGAPGEGEGTVIDYPPAPPASEGGSRNAPP